jgi:hypothetical protein
MIKNRERSVAMLAASPGSIATLTRTKPLWIAKQSVVQTTHTRATYRRLVGIPKGFQV